MPKAYLLSNVDVLWCHTGACSSSARERSVSYSMLRPTYTHEALQKLVSSGLLKHVISQNTDGLHRLSGIPHEHLSELHGNAFHERCEKCATKYERAFAARAGGTAVPEHRCIHCHCNHRTGRICERKVSILIGSAADFSFYFGNAYWYTSSTLLHRL